MREIIGIDLGSRTTKIVFRDNGKIAHKEIFDTGYNPLEKVGRSIKSIGKFRFRSL